MSSRWDHVPLQPCGTPAARRRHRRRQETCAACLAAVRRPPRPLTAGTAHKWFHWCADRPVTLALRECWCCASPRVRYSSRGPLCATCWDRWERKGFNGPGPGPSQKPPIRDSAREYADVITSMTARQAGARLGRSAREIVRWRAALREAS